MRAVGDECSCFERSGEGRLQGGRAPAPASLAEQPTGTRGEGKAEALTEPGVLGAGKENGGSPKGGKVPAEVLYRAQRVSNRKVEDQLERTAFA